MTNGTSEICSLFSVLVSSKGKCFASQTSKRKDDGEEWSGVGHVNSFTPIVQFIFIFFECQRAPV